METFEKIAGFLSGTCSRQEKEELEAWRKKNPANEEEFLKIEKVWKAATPSALFRPDSDAAWKKVSGCIFGQTEEASVPKQQISVPFYRSPLVIAAAVAFFIVASGIFFIIRPNAAKPAGTNMAVIATKAGEKRDLLLADGSHIWLNENSKLFYPEKFNGSSREVKLEGEAFFEVAHLPEKPFTVRAGAGIVKVLGTSFNIEAYDNVQVQVAGGRVSFSGPEPDKALILNTGDAAYLAENLPEKENPDPNFLAWKTGEFVFEDQELQKVFAALEKYYPVKLTAASPEILNCRLFASFRSQPLEEVLKVLSLTLNLKADYKPGQSEVVFSHQEQGQSCSAQVQ